MDGSAEKPGNSEAFSGAVSEFVAARPLGLSVDTLRRDRRLGPLGIPFVKYGSGRCGAVRYDLADLERFIESKKPRTLPVARPAVEVQAPATPVMLALPTIEPFEEVEEPVRADRSAVAGAPIAAAQHVGCHRRALCGGGRRRGPARGEPPRDAAPRQILQPEMPINQTKEAPSPCQHRDA